MIDANMLNIRAVNPDDRRNGPSMLDENEDFDDFDIKYLESLTKNNTSRPLTQKVKDEIVKIKSLLEADNNVLTPKELDQKKTYIAKMYVIFKLLNDPRNLNFEYVVNEDGSFKFEFVRDEKTNRVRKIKIKTGGTYVTCSTKQMGVYLNGYKPNIETLIELHNIVKIKDGGFSEGMTHYQVLKDLDYSVFDISDFEINQKIAYLWENPTRNWLKTNLPDGFNIELDKDLTDLIAQGEESLEHYLDRLSEYGESINIINSGDAGAFRGHDSVCGRTYCVMSNLPKVIRGGLRYRNRRDSVAEIDINAAIPRLLGSVVKEIVAKRIDIDKTNLQSFKDGKSRTFINNGYIESSGELSQISIDILNDVERYNSLISETDFYKTLIDALKLDVDREGLKEHFLKICFGTEEDDTNHILKNAISEKFKSVFPAMFGFIKLENAIYRKYKKGKKIARNRELFTSMIFAKESRIMKRTAKAFPLVPKITQFDAIFIPKQFKESVDAKFKEIFEEETNVKVCLKIKIIQSEETKNDVARELKLRTWKDPKSGKEYYKKEINGKKLTILASSSIYEIRMKFSNN